MSETLLGYRTRRHFAAADGAVYALVSQKRIPQSARPTARALLGVRLRECSHSGAWASESFAPAFESNLGRRKWASAFRRTINAEPGAFLTHSRATKDGLALWNHLDVRRRAARRAAGAA